MDSLFKTWARCLNPNPEARLRLFCFPYAGGGASLFRRWPSHLPSTVEVYAIQLPGREDRFKDAPHTHLLPLVQQLTQVLIPIATPYALYGHSLGALICFELARQLRAQEHPLPIHLFLSGRRAPHLGDRNPIMHLLPEKQFIDELRQLNGTPASVLESEFMQVLLPTLRADFSMCGTYQYRDEPPLNCPISVFGGYDDQEETRDRLEGWNLQTCSAFFLEMLPGDHFFLISHQQLLLDHISRQLSELSSSEAD